MDNYIKPFKAMKVGETQFIPETYLPVDMIIKTYRIAQSKGEGTFEGDNCEVNGVFGIAVTRVG